MKNQQIQGLRAIAVLAVVLYHAGINWIPGGFVGVDVFFVISGFLITQMIVKELATTGKFNFPNFYARRLRRLLPASAVVIMTTIGISRHLISPLRFRDTGIDALSSILYGANYRFYYSQIDYLNIGAKPSLFLHFWSLAVEEQFYFVWPLLMFIGYMLFKKLGIVALLIPVAGFSFYFSAKLSTSNPMLAFYSLPTRAWEFAIGSLSYFLIWKFSRIPGQLKFILGWSGVIGLIYSMISIKDTIPFPGYIALLPTISTALVLVASFHGKFFDFYLISNPLFNSIGAISYSLYLWHWPVYQLMSEVIGRNSNGPDIKMYFVLSFAFAIASYFLIEKPIRGYRRLGARPSFSFIWGGFVTLISGFVAMTLLGLNFATITPTQAQTLPTPNISQPVEAAVTPTPTASLNGAGQIKTISLADTVEATKITNISSKCQKDVAVVIAVDCMTGSITSKKVIVLFGDSHAGQWEVPLGNFSTSHQFKVYNFLKSGCGAAELTYRYGPTGLVPYPQCPQYRASAIARIIALKPQLLVVSTSSYRSDAADSSNKDAFWESAYAPLLTKMRKAGIKVLILGDTPYPKNNIPDCLSQNLSDVAKCDFKVSDGVSKFHQTENFANWVSAQGGFFFNPTPLLCNEVTCFAVIDGIIVYRDGSHLSDLYSQKLFSAIEPTLNDSLGKDSAGLISPTNAPVVKPSITPSSASASSEKIVASSGTVTLAQLKSAYFAGTCMNTREAKIATPCIVGDKLSNKSLVLFGDSHAGQWQEALNSIGLSLGYRVYVFNKSGCPSADIYVDNITTRAHEYPACPLWRANAISQIRALKIKPSLIIIASLGQYSGSPSTQAASSAQSYSNWVSGLTSTTNKLGSDPKRIVILADTPFPITNVVDCLSKNLLKPAKCDLKRKVAVGYNNRILAIQKVSQTLGNPYIDPTEWLCNETICPAVIGKVIAYADASHISREMSIRLIPNLISAIKPLLFN